MSTYMLSQLKYNHEISFKYSYCCLGFDVYQATFQASIPHRPIKIVFGKWYVDCRLFKWQIVINKMTRAQLSGLQSHQNSQKNQADNSFHLPTFGF